MKIDRFDLTIEDLDLFIKYYQYIYNCILNRVKLTSKQESFLSVLDEYNYYLEDIK